jgi:hypothetical protein
VGAEDHRGAVRHLVEFLDEHRTERAQPVDDELVVHDLVPHVDRRTEQLHRTLDDVDRPVDAGTETAGIGEEDAHQEVVGGRWSVVSKGRLKSGPHWPASSPLATGHRPLATGHCS